MSQTKTAKEFISRKRKRKEERVDREDKRGKERKKETKRERGKEKKTGDERQKGILNEE